MVTIYQPVSWMSDSVIRHDEAWCLFSMLMLCLFVLFMRVVWCGGGRRFAFPPYVLASVFTGKGWLMGYPT